MTIVLNDKTLVEEADVPYKGVNQEELGKKLSIYLGNNGASFREDIIVGSKGLYCYTASSHQFLDWPPGQMSYLLRHGDPEIVKVLAQHAAISYLLFALLDKTIRP
jgi:adenosylmethionine-8-amino-7-oxononanoate aminotransferase